MKYPLVKAVFGLNQSSFRPVVIGILLLSFLFLLCACCLKRHSKKHSEKDVIFSLKHIREGEELEDGNPNDIVYSHYHQENVAKAHFIFIKTFLVSLNTQI